MVPSSTASRSSYTTNTGISEWSVVDQTPISSAMPFMLQRRCVTPNVGTSLIPMEACLLGYTCVDFRVADSRSTPDSVATVRERMRLAAKQSGMTQEEIGVRMGYAKDSARKAVSRLLNAEVEYDPRLSTLLAFAQALEVPLKDLL
jgi:hypothetical protein